MLAIDDSSDLIPVCKIEGPALTAASAAAVRAQISNELKRAGGRLVVDLSSVQNIDTQGMAVLFGVHRTIQPEGYLLLTGLSAPLKEVFRLAGMDRLLTMRH